MSGAARCAYRWKFPRKENEMPTTDPSDILIATTPAGYQEIQNVLDAISSLHVPDARHPSIPKPVPGWMRAIADELQETDAESPFAAQEMAFDLARDARYLERDMEVRIVDDQGVVLGWNSVEWDEDDLVCDAIRQVVSESSHPMEFARVAGMDDFEEWENQACTSPDDLKYSVCVEPSVTICYPPEWYRKNAAAHLD